MQIQLQKVQNIKDALKLKTPKIKGNYILTEKIDGWDTTILYDASKQQWQAPISSAGRIIPSLQWTTELFDKLPKPKYNCFLKAEAYCEAMPFHILNGCLNRTVGNFSFKDIQFMFHDLVYLTNKEIALNRYIELNKLIQTTKHFRVNPILLVSDYNEKLWRDIFDKVVNQDGEGIVAKQEHSLYSFGKRNSDLLKMKLELTVDCLAVDLTQTVGEKGYLSLVLTAKRKNGTLINVVIGNLELQNKFLKEPSTVIGKIVTIKAMEEFEDSTLRQPVFGCVREDKLLNEID